MHKRSLNKLVALTVSLCMALYLVPVPLAFSAVTTDTITPSVINQKGKKTGNIYTTTLDEEVYFSFPLTAWSGSYKSISFAVLSDSDVEGSSYAYNGGDGYGCVAVLGRGVHNVVVREAFKDAKGKDKHYIDYTLKLKLKCVAINEDNVVTYPTQTTALKANYTQGKVSWTSSAPAIAAVDAKGVVTAYQKGRCYIYAAAVSQATRQNVVLRVLVEVTYKKAYLAVQNALADYQNAALKYSQGKRMAKNYRDCSSFVSRCYYDAKLGRSLCAIGGTAAKSWAFNAAAQAKWLYKNKRYVAKKAVSLSRLLPGDTIYYETDYAGMDTSQWRCIDHAALYVGGGKVLNTSSNGPYGCIGYRWNGYSKKDASIKFIGRPLKK